MFSIPAIIVHLHGWFFSLYRSRESETCRLLHGRVVSGFVRFVFCFYIVLLTTTEDYPSMADRSCYMPDFARIKLDVRF